MVSQLKGSGKCKIAINFAAPDGLDSLGRLKEVERSQRSRATGLAAHKGPPEAHLAIVGESFHALARLIGTAWPAAGETGTQFSPCKPPASFRFIWQPQNQRLCANTHSPDQDPPHLGDRCSPGRLHLLASGFSLDRLTGCMRRRTCSTRAPLGATSAHSCNGHRLRLIRQVSGAPLLVVLHAGNKTLALIWPFQVLSLHVLV